MKRFIKSHPIVTFLLILMFLAWLRSDDPETPKVAAATEGPTGKNITPRTVSSPGAPAVKRETIPSNAEETASDVADGLLKSGTMRLYRDSNKEVQTLVVVAVSKVSKQLHPGAGSIWTGMKVSSCLDSFAKDMPGLSVAETAGRCAAR